MLASNNDWVNLSWINKNMDHYSNHLRLIAEIITLLLLLK